MSEIQMTVETPDNWPRSIQANIARFYLRVIAPAVRAATVHDEVVIGVAPDLDTFLDRAKDQVDNYTANEANKVYALTLVALFERYLRLWAAQELAGEGVSTAYVEIAELLDLIGKKASVDLETGSLKSILMEVHLVGNVVRHGEGRSMERLRYVAGHLVDRSKRQYVDLIDQGTPDSEWLRIQADDLDRYFTAMIRFWGLCDRQPNAVTSMFVGG